MVVEGKGNLPCCSGFEFLTAMAFNPLPCCPPMKFCRCVDEDVLGGATSIRNGVQSKEQASSEAQ